MWNTNSYESNSCIWLILLILIFFRNSSSNFIDPGSYFRLTNSQFLNNNFTRGLFN